MGGTLIVGRVAAEGETVARRYRGTIALSVALRASAHGVSVALADNALGAIDIFAAAALSVALAIETAGPRCTQIAKRRMGWFHTGGNEAAVAKRRRQIAGLASVRTGRGATDTVGTEAALTLGVASTGFSLALAVISRIGRTRRRCICSKRVCCDGIAVSAGRSAIHVRRGVLFAPWVGKQGCNSQDPDQRQSTKSANV